MNDGKIRRAFGWPLGLSRSRRRALALVLFGLALTLANASWLAPRPDGSALLLAHRGVHQLYDRSKVGKNGCSAAHLLSTPNPFIENTLESMQASFDLGADIIEIDVHPTTDGDFAVFHDWTVDCRTNGHGVTREHSMAQLKALDVGWGYTADGGKTYPYRGKGVGKMPRLAEVFQRFPEKRFLINIKSRWREEGRLLFEYLAAHHVDIRRQVMVYGNDRPLGSWKKAVDDGRSFSKQSLKRCTMTYLAMGWTGLVPPSCRNGVIAVPIAYRHFFWGWPNRFQSRMTRSDTRIIVMGKIEDITSAPGITDPKDLDVIPSGFEAIIWTDSIERVGPAWLKRQKASGR